jgi:hypothetical protein
VLPLYTRNILLEREVARYDITPTAAAQTTTTKTTMLN